MHIGVYGLTFCCIFVAITKVSFPLFKKKKSIQMPDLNLPLPFEIQEEILKRVPDVKSLLQFRSVSKSWKSFIDNPRFIANYHSQPRHHIFLWYLDSVRYKYNYVSVIDNDDDDSHSFAQNRVPLTIPSSIYYVKSVLCSMILGCSNGLFCFYIDSRELTLAVLWNPSIRKSVTIDMPRLTYEYTDGFGVSPYSNDPKLLRIQRLVRVLDSKPRRVEIYSLSTGEWRTLLENLPCSSVEFNASRHVAIGNFIFWHAQGKVMGMKREMIILFDMRSDKFMEIYLPDYVVTNDQSSEFTLCKLRESLVVVESYIDHNVEKQCYHVWMMEGGVSDSFTKMYSIVRPDLWLCSLLAFRNNGQPIITTKNYGEYENELVVYEPDSDEFTRIGDSDSRRTYYASAYMETLLLLNH